MTAALKMPTKPGTYMCLAPGWDESSWTSIPNPLIRDVRVSWDAKGAFTWIASHKQLIYELNAEKLAEAGPRGRDHAHEMLRELEYFGWLTRHRYRAVDSRGTVHLWMLHPEPVDFEDRTWKPSRKQVREGYTAPDGTKFGTPEILTGQELRPKRKFPQVKSESLDGQEVPPGIPDRSGPDQSGIRYMEEGSQVEEIPPTPRDAGGSAAPPEAPPAPPDPDRCEAHNRARCRPCGLSPRVRAAEAKARASAEIAEGEARARACPMCQQHPSGAWLRAVGSVAISPPLVCDHETSTSAALAELAAAEEAQERAQTGQVPVVVPVADPDLRGRLRTGWKDLRSDDRPPGVSTNGSATRRGV